MASNATCSSAKTVARAIQFLRLVASSKTRHLRLVDLAEMASMDKSTTHRLLQRLVQEGMLARDPGQRGYRLGPLLHELGLAALPRSNLREVAHPALQQLAQTTGDMAFLVGRSGYESICLSHVTGNFAIQTMTQGIGDRHPLGVGAGGLAIFAALSPAEQTLVIEAIRPQLRRYGLNEKALKAQAAKAHDRGAAIDEGNVAVDVTAIGRVINDQGGTPIGAVFVASIRNRMVESRLQDVDKRLIACVNTIQVHMRK